MPPAPDQSPLEKPAKFRWPPKQSADAPHSAPAHDAGWDAKPDVPWWRVIERTFFGVARATWTQRIEDAGWQPDSSEVYCPRCGHSLGSAGGASLTTLADGVGCTLCAHVVVPWHKVVRMGEYDGVLRDAILEVKFSAWRSLGGALGGQFATSLMHELAANGVDPAQVLLVPVPTSTMRRISRGIDHTRVLARAVARRCGVPLVPLLARAHRPPQTGRTLDQRRRNVAKSMRVRESVLTPRELDGKTILLLDDVMTSGATMREACRAIQDWLRKFEQTGQVRPATRVWVVPVAVTSKLDDAGRPGHLRA